MAAYEPSANKRIAQITEKLLLLAQTASQRRLSQRRLQK
jgi:hypothetical protein